MRGLCDTMRTFRDSSRRFGESIRKPIANSSHPSEIGAEELRGACIQPRCLNRVIIVVEKVSLPKSGTCEPFHEKTCFCICENKEADKHLCSHYIESMIPLLPKSEISSIQPSSMAVQLILRRTRSETPQIGFVTTWLMYHTPSQC